MSVQLGVADEVTVGLHFGALVAKCHQNFEKAEGLVADNDREVCRRNVESEFSVGFIGLVADGAVAIAENEAHIERLCRGRQHVLEEVPEAILKTEAEQVELAQFANGGKNHSA